MYTYISEDMKISQLVSHREVSCWSWHNMAVELLFGLEDSFLVRGSDAVWERDGIVSEVLLDLIGRGSVTEPLRIALPLTSLCSSPIALPRVEWLARLGTVCDWLGVSTALFKSESTETLLSTVSDDWAVDTASAPCAVEPVSSTVGEVISPAAARVPESADCSSSDESAGSEEVKGVDAVRLAVVSLPSLWDDLLKYNISDLLCTIRFTLTVLDFIDWESSVFEEAASELSTFIVFLRPNPLIDVLGYIISVSTWLSSSSLSFCDAAWGAAETRTGFCCCANSSTWKSHALTNKFSLF